jgi:hypothetical protein
VTFKVGSLAGVKLDTWNAPGLTSGTVILAGTNTEAVAIDDVSIKPAGGTDSVVTKTAAGAMTLTSGNAGATVHQNVSASKVTVGYNLTAISTDGDSNIVVPTGSTGVTISVKGTGAEINAATAVTVDISALVAADTVKLIGHTIAFTVRLKPDGANYTVSGLVIDGGSGASGLDYTISGSGAVTGDINVPATGSEVTITPSSPMTYTVMVNTGS